MSEPVAAYREASRMVDHDGGARLELATAAGATPNGLVSHPQFFQGWLARPDVAAAGLLALVEVASTRYFKPVPRAVSLDPVLTAHGDRLRCESMSACHGVYARLDLNADLLGNAGIGLGTTNIDIHGELTRALGALRSDSRLFLSVGADEVRVRMAGADYRERKVDLPERWVRSLAETQAIAAGLQLRAEFDAAGWRGLVNSLPTGGGSGAGVTLWLVPAARGLRPSRQPQADSICLAGTSRLAALRRLQHLVQRVRVYGPTVDRHTPAATSAWQIDVPGARLTLLLSPQPFRGFSGEGAVLAALSQADQRDASTLGALLAWEAAIDMQAIANEGQFDEARAGRALQVLATSGHVGFDLAEGRYFHRQLPFVAERLQDNYPRLAAARALVDAGAVSAEGDHFVVLSNGRRRYVTLSASSRCTCDFWIRHQGTRGPCKHALAAQIWRKARSE